MNDAFDSLDEPDDMGSETLGGYSYTMGVFFGVFIIILILTYVSNMCNLLCSADNPALRHTIPANTSTDDDSTSMGLGLDDATLIACPKFLYSDIGKFLDGGSTVSGCSICLANYRSADVIRLLPYCGHLFHLQCIDTWLRIHPTCPICRNSPLAGDRITL